MKYHFTLDPGGSNIRFYKFAKIAISVCICFIGIIQEPSPIQAQDYHSNGEAFLEQQEYRLAAIELLKAVQQRPDNIESWRFLGYSYRRLDILDSAIASYSKILAIVPDDYDAHLALGNLYSWIPKYDSSEMMFSHILANDSTDSAALLGLGRINAWQGRYQKAIEYYRQVLRFEPDNIRAFGGMAWAYAWNDDLQNARGNFETAIIKDSTFAESYEGLARINLWTDRPFSAIKYINRALLIDPENRQYRLLRDELSSSADINLDNAYTYWQENDWGRITKNHQVEETIFRRFSDRWYWSANLAGLWSLRDSSSIERRAIAFSGRCQVSSNLMFAGSIGYELVNKDIDRSTFKVGLFSIKPIRAVSVELRKSIYEPWSKTTSTSIVGDLSSYTYKRLTLSAGGGVWDISDKNRRVIGTISIKKRIINNPILNVGYRYRYWDFDFRSPDYYSPLDLNQHELGTDFRFGLNRWISVEGDGYYSLNSDEVEAFSGSLSLELTMGKSSVGIISFSGYDNNSDYNMFNITGRLQIRL